jgi:hypothetical protein
MQDVVRASSISYITLCKYLERCEGTETNVLLFVLAPVYSFKNHNRKSGRRCESVAVPPL